jgi:hypothetical protein
VGQAGRVRAGIGFVPFGMGRSRGYPGGRIKAGLGLWRAGVAVRLRAGAARRACDDAPVTARNGAAVAREVQTLVTGDLDGSAAEGTVRFGPDGAEHEIDLNAGHARQLRDALAACVRAGRRVSGGSGRPARGGRRGPAGGLTATEVREWAKAHGIEVKDRGRVPAELVARFRAATSQ